MMQSAIKEFKIKSFLRLINFIGLAPDQKKASDQKTQKKQFGNNDSDNDKIEGNLYSKKRTKYSILFFLAI